MRVNLPLLPWALALGLAVLTGCCSAELSELEASDPDDRRQALGCLVEQCEGDPSLRAPLVRAALALKEPAVEPDPAVRGAALRALRVLRERSSTASVRSALQSEPEGSVRGAAIELLASFAAREQDPADLEVVRRHLQQDKDRDVRLAAARELAAWGDRSPATTGALLRALEDYDPSVRHNARRSLGRLYQTDQGLSSKAWQRWLDEQAAAADEPRPDDGPPLPEGPEELPARAPAEPDEPVRPEEYTFPEQDPFAPGGPGGAPQPGGSPDSPSPRPGEPEPPSEPEPGPPPPSEPEPGPPPPSGPESGPPPPSGPEGGGS